VIPVPVLARLRDQIGEPIQELKRRELDQAVRAGPRGLPPAARADAVGGLAPGHRVADATVGTADHGEPFEREGRPGAIPQEVLETLKIAGHIAADGAGPTHSI
jgi:hypothetical protein